MLTAPWKRIVLALRLLASGLALGALSAGLSFSRVEVVGEIRVVASAVATLGALLFASVPRVAYARGAAIVAAAFFVLDLLCRLALIRGPSSLLVVAPFFGLLGVLAHIRALGLVGLYLRVDKIYERASSLWVVLVVAIAGVLIASTLSCLMPAAGAAVGLVLTIVDVVIPVVYVILVLKTAATIRTLLPKP